MNRIFFPFFRLHKTPCFFSMPSKPSISYFLQNQSREIPGQMAIFQSYKWRDLFLERHFFQKFSGHLAVFQAVSEGTLFRTSFYQVPGHLAVFGHGNEGTFLFPPLMYLENDMSARLDMRVRGSFSATVTRPIRREIRDRNWTGKENRRFLYKNIKK